ncbi:UDP-N-acetylglucosamine 4,6-dehydratase (inverting) [Candidatus Bipolaricaulota bacterium]
MALEGKTLLVTGGTGSFGNKFAETMLKEHSPKAIRILSRGELLQLQMSQQFDGDPRLRFFIGDVRDKSRLSRAMNGVDIVVHAAALKHVPACEYNPIEAIKTNIDGTANVIDAAIDNGVEKLIALSTDKAAHPSNLYGATKLVAERLFVQANAYVGERETKLSCVRYGNVIGSRGSVVPLFIRQRKTGKITITDPRMTRFWITLEQGVKFVLRCLEEMQGGEVFVPKIPSMSVVDLARALAPECSIEEIGIRPGEKLHEVLISEDESRNVVERKDMYVIRPDHQWWSKGDGPVGNSPVEGFCYASNTNAHWLAAEELRAMIGEPEERISSG